MIFRRIVFASLLVGLMAGAIYGWFQQAQVVPIIHAAEAYDVATGFVAAHQPGTADHVHGDAGQRMLLSMTANILIGVAFALCLVALMTLHNLKAAKPQTTPARGLAWGMALMLAVFVAPVLSGLHPEIPGVRSTDLDARRLWWWLCVAAAAVGLAMIYYARMRGKLLGAGMLLIICLPGARSIVDPVYSNSDPAAAAALSALSTQFFKMTALGLLLFCLLLGGLSGYAATHVLKRE